jgi:hypothetical protein
MSRQLENNRNSLHIKHLCCTSTNSCETDMSETKGEKPF